MLETLRAPEALSPFVTTFVCRDEKVDGSVVRLLPETRSSIQLRLKDPYWIRERGKASPWRRVADISIWGPRRDWGYGYAQSHIKVFAFVLTPVGFRSLLKHSVGSCLNTTLDGSSMETLQEIRATGDTELFHQWANRVSRHLLELFQDADPSPDISAGALAVLASEGGNAVSQAASLEGISSRHFRRRFVETYGIAPKHYQRLLRVDRQIRSLHPAAWEQDPFDPAPISFADQSHLIREFRDTIGMTPLHYMRRKQNGDSTLRSVVEPGIAPPAGG